jgi:hypothetical protein
MVKLMDAGLSSWFLCGSLMAGTAGAIEVSIGAHDPKESANVPRIHHAVQSTARVELPSGYVWECRVNGQRTFSDAPCGARAVVRQLGQLNRMDSTPAVSYDSYETAYAAAADQTAPDYQDDSYVNQALNSYSERVSRGHRSRHGNQSRGRPR